jgi:hypothetical protein
MTEAEWLDCTDPQKMLLWLRGKVSDRKLRLFAVACCRAVWSQLNDPIARRAVAVGERYAEGLAEQWELEVAQKEVAPFGYVAGDAALVAAYGAVGDVPVVWAPNGAANLAYAEVAWQALSRGVRHIPPGTKQHIREAQADLLRCVIGPTPYRSVTALTSWFIPEVVALAQTIYDERAFARLPELADTVAAAGCTEAEVLEHLRSEGPHARGCWALDAVLGKSGGSQCHPS